MIERRASDSNPLVPALGCLPPARDDIEAPKERVMHVALRDEREKQPGLARALRSIADGYADVDWLACEKIGAGAVRSAMRACAAMLRPTLVFMQMQRRTDITPDVITELRDLCDPSVVIVNWDGDQHHDALSPERAWFRELGLACDTSLVVNTQHPAAYASWGVRNPGYLQIGIDSELYQPRYAPAITVTSLTEKGVERSRIKAAPSVVMLASRYAGYAPYKRRQDIVDALEKWYGDGGFGVYGNGWTGPCAHPMLKQDEEALVYSAALAAISMSIRNDLPRYTSDRLFRALASGAYVLVERFPDMEGLGLIDGFNCRAWTGWGELEHHIIQAEPRDPEYARIRSAAERLAFLHHTWDARMPELLYIVDTVRAAR